MVLIIKVTKDKIDAKIIFEDKIKSTNNSRAAVPLKPKLKGEFNHLPYINSIRNQNEN